MDIGKGAPGKHFAMSAAPIMAKLIRTAFYPPLTGALLAALTLSPPTLREPLTDLLSQHLSPPTLARTITTLKYLFTLGLIPRLNAFLSTLVQNNFRLRSLASDYNWSKEIVVITGAAGGFGALMCESFASHGLTVIALDIAPSMPAHLTSNPKIHYYTCDVTSPSAVASTASTIQSTHGDPSILINNAGIGCPGPILDISPEKLQQIFSVNVLSHYHALRAFLPAMIARNKGHVVTVASMASFITTPTIVPYANTKAAIMSLHEGLGAELRSPDIYNAPNVLTTCVHPIWAATNILEGNADMLRKRGQIVLEPGVVVEKIVSQVLGGRGGQLVVGGGTEWVAGIRGWPNWLSGLLLRGI